MSNVLENKVITRSAYVRSTTESMLSNREVEFVISSESVDTYDTVFRISGWKLDRYLKNPIVCYQHRSTSSDPDDVIGTSTLRIEDGKLIGTVRFEDAEVNPKAEKVFQKVVNGTLKMASVGAIIGRADFGDKSKGEDPNVLYFSEQELLEWSIVSVGSNPDAHKRNAQTIEEIRTSVAKEIDVQEEDVTTFNKKTKRNVREAQLIINKNRK